MSGLRCFVTFLGAFAVPLLGQSSPNLIIIETDEHHYSTLGCYGSEIVKTPNIDWLAKTGALCTSFYANTPVCSPSRGALVSGRYPQNTPVVTNNIPLGDDIITFAEILRRRGYATSYVGKWHLDGPGKPQWAPKRKFGFEDNRYMFNRGHWKKFELGAKGPAVASRNAKGKADYGVAGADEKSFSTDWLISRAIEFIDAHEKEPFCAMISLPDPHGPNTVRAPYDTMYADVKVPIPVSLRKKAEQTPEWARIDRRLTALRLCRLMPSYYGMVKCIDDNVGRILETLRERGLIDKTIIVFTSDHGDLCGEHGRLNKGVPYEGSAKVPFLLRYPAKVPAGTVIDQALSCVDFLPTTLALMGVQTAGKEEGRDASALFRGETPADWDDISFLRATSGADWLCAVTDRYKLVYSSKDQPWLFDLKDDPDELTNVFSLPRHGEVVEALTRKLSSYCQEHGDPYGENPKVKAQMASVIDRR